ncbi:MAG: bifunctional phosphoglucose/phosphomannose isomerase [Baekduia sp.]
MAITTGLDRDAISRVDLSDQLADVLAMPEHLRDAVFKAEAAALETVDSPGGLVVAGMGGSSIGGRLARAILGDTCSRPVLAARSYELPPWTTPETTVLCSSYSGNTEETLACYEAAGALGARRVVATSGGQIAELARKEGVQVIPIAGGLQPRAAVAYMTVAALEAAQHAGAGPGITYELDVAAEHLDRLVGEWGPDAPEDALPKQLARALYERVPLVAGAGLTAPIAYRWKTQLNENAKIPAFSHELPEHGHNELVGWEGSPELGSFAAVFLEDSDSHPRIARRVELTAALISERGGEVHRVATVGETTAERVFSGVLLGDLVSLYLAVLRGVDPGPVDVIEALKGELASQ